MFLHQDIIVFRQSTYWQGAKHKAHSLLIIFYFKTPLILSWLPNCKLEAFHLIYRRKLWSLSLRWNEIIPELPTLRKFYVKSPQQEEVTKHWKIFRDFISLPDNDKVDFVLPEGKWKLIYHQLPRCHRPHFTVFKQPQLSDAPILLVRLINCKTPDESHGRLPHLSYLFLHRDKAGCAAGGKPPSFYWREKFDLHCLFSLCRSWKHPWKGQPPASSLPSSCSSALPFSSRRMAPCLLWPPSEECLGQIFKEAQESIRKVTLTGLVQITHKFLIWSWLPNRPTVSLGEALADVPQEGI